MSDFELCALFILSVIMMCQIYAAIRMSDVYTGIWSLSKRLERWESCLINVSRKNREDE